MAFGCENLGNLLEDTRLALPEKFSEPPTLMVRSEWLVNLERQTKDNSRQGGREVFSLNGIIKDSSTMKQEHGRINRRQFLKTAGGTIVGAAF